MHQELPARPDLEHYRKAAKELVRAFRDGDARAVRRAEAVLRGRAHERFALSDAQYVIAAEHGYASWAEFKRACERTGVAVVDSDRRYTEGRQVEVRVRRREQRYQIDDDGAAVRLAAKPRGWLPVAEHVVEAFSLNVNRRGVVFVGTVYPDWVEELAERVAEASLAVYEALLELDA